MDGEGFGENLLKPITFPDGYFDSGVRDVEIITMINKRILDNAIERNIVVFDSQSNDFSSRLVHMMNSMTRRATNKTMNAIYLFKWHLVLLSTPVENFENLPTVFGKDLYIIDGKTGEKAVKYLNEKAYFPQGKSNWVLGSTETFDGDEMPQYILGCY